MSQDEQMRLMMIVNEPQIAGFIVDQGVNRIFVDLESLGKQARQGHLDTWMSSHTPSDINLVRQAIGSAELLVRLNPLNPRSFDEIEDAIARGADCLMLPMFRTMADLEAFCGMVAGRLPVIPLVETGEAFEILSKVARCKGVSEVFIGLNDLRLSLGLRFLFEPLINGMLDQAAAELRDVGVPWGFGGLARHGEGILPAELILGEHVRLGSTSAILSRTFHRMASNLDELLEEMDFNAEIAKLRSAELYFREAGPEMLAANHSKVERIIQGVRG